MFEVAPHHLLSFLTCMLRDLKPPQEDIRTQFCGQYPKEAKEYDRVFPKEYNKDVNVMPMC